MDIGCGPAEVLETLPQCEYYGFDIIESQLIMQKKYNKKKYHFFCKNLITGKLKIYQHLIT